MILILFSARQPCRTLPGRRVARQQVRQVVRLLAHRAHAGGAGPAKQLPLADAECHGVAAAPVSFCPAMRAASTCLSPTGWHGYRVFRWSGGIGCATARASRASENDTSFSYRSSPVASITSLADPRACRQGRRVGDVISAEWIADRRVRGGCDGSGQRRRRRLPAGGAGAWPVVVSRPASAPRTARPRRRRAERGGCAAG